VRIVELSMLWGAPCPLYGELTDLPLTKVSSTDWDRACYWNKEFVLMLILGSHYESSKPKTSTRGLWLT
jgi:hypothetical protein